MLLPNILVHILELVLHSLLTFKLRLVEFNLEVKAIEKTNI